MLRYCANLKAIRYESTSLNRIVADKSHSCNRGLTLIRYESVACSYLLHGCDVIRILKLCIEERGENENDIMPSVINMNRSRFPVF